MPPLPFLRAARSPDWLGQCPQRWVISGVLAEEGVACQPHTLRRVGRAGSLVLETRALRRPDPDPGAWPSGASRALRLDPTGQAWERQEGLLRQGGIVKWVSKDE